MTSRALIELVVVDVLARAAVWCVAIPMVFLVVSANWITAGWFCRIVERRADI